MTDCRANCSVVNNKVDALAQKLFKSMLFGDFGDVKIFDRELNWEMIYDGRFYTNIHVRFNFTTSS